MPERPAEPTATQKINDLMERVRLLERQIIRLPEGASPLRTFDDGEPLGDTLAIDFGVNLVARLIGDGFVQVDGAGGESGWDAIVDGTLGASSPGDRLFLGIGEAMNYLRTTLGQTKRAFILVRGHPTLDGNGEMPDGRTYVETANVTGPDQTFIVSTAALLGSGQSLVDPVLPRWDHDGYVVGAINVAVWGMEIIGKEANNGAQNKSYLFQAFTQLFDCRLLPGLMTTSNNRYRVAQIANGNDGQSWLHRCRMVDGWFAFTEADDCDLRVFTSGTYEPFVSTGANKVAIRRSRLRTDTSSGSAATWTLSTIPSFFLLELERPNTASGAGTLTINITGGEAELNWIGPAPTTSINVTHSSGAPVTIRGRGWNTITLGSPGTPPHNVDVEISSSNGTVDVTGPATINVRTEGLVILRGKAVHGFIGTRHGGSSGIAVSFVDADEANINVAGSPRVASSGTHQAYSLDINSQRCILDYAGASLYAVAGTDLGLGNLVRTT